MKIFNYSQLLQIDEAEILKMPLVRNNRLAYIKLWDINQQQTEKKKKSAVCFHYLKTGYSLERQAHKIPVFELFAVGHFIRANKNQHHQTMQKPTEPSQASHPRKANKTDRRLLSFIPMGHNGPETEVVLKEKPQQISIKLCITVGVNPKRSQVSSVPLVR